MKIRKRAVIASFSPGHLLIPNPNGMKAFVGIKNKPFSKNLSGLKISGFCQYSVLLII